MIAFLSLFVQVLVSSFKSQAQLEAEMVIIAYGGAPRIHGELLKLGFEVAQSTVAKYMARRGRGRSQTWSTFLYNHAAGIAAWTSCSCRRSALSCSSLWSFSGANAAARYLSA
ncbi:MAG: putative transposase [Acidobacteriaceae bacterium]|jgi:hypothetical protein|nr:putative transposase [Acidobacteriaceae bacterium]